MIERIIDFSARNRWLVIGVTLALIAAALHALRTMPLDAVPDLSDTQVIVYSRWDRSPDIVEDQVTYPLVTALLGAPGVKAIRGLSDFGYSFVYVIFQDGTDMYWARTRVLEYLNKIQVRLPEGVRTELGPDASGVGWVYQYALVDRTGRQDRASLRSFQDWYLRPWLQSVPGVAEVASVGGFQKQYQVNVDPAALLARGISLSAVIDAVRSGNNDTGGRLLEISGTEYMVRSRGYIRSLDDIAGIVVGQDSEGTPVLVRQVASVVAGPDIRRGVADLDGTGDTPGGIIVMRQGENALNVINRVKQKIAEVRPGFPPGVELVATYDRSDLIHRAIATLRHQLLEEMIIVSAVILLFLWHLPSALVPIVTIPVAVLLAFIPMAGLKLTTNIMSLSGIAISIGVLVDGAIVEVENAYRKLQRWKDGGRVGDPREVRLSALKEVGPSVFFSLLVIAVAFLPVFTLLDQEGRLFRPLAFSKNFAMAIAAVLAVTLDPAIRMLFTRVDPVVFHPRWLAGFVNAAVVGTYHPEERHPVSRALFRVYEPVCRFVLRHRVGTLVVAGALMLATVPVYLRLGHEFMPPLNEGTILYMPTTLPGISVSEAEKLLVRMDQVIRTLPEVARVHGKAGRADTSTDPAPLSMMETVIVLKPESEWRPGMTWEKIVAELDARMQFPGVTNAWTMPIKARTDMLATGIRTPVGIKVSGADLGEIERIARHVEQTLRDIPGTRSVYAERVTGGYFLDMDIRREAIARYGLTIADVQAFIDSAVGGTTLTTTVEGRERYGVAVRYGRSFRDTPEALRRILVPVPSGAQVPLGELADIVLRSGPAMIRDENGMLTGYVYVDIAGRDVGRYVDDARAAVARAVPLPSGYALVWSGQYENMLRVRERLKTVIPLTLLLILALLYLNMRSLVRSAIVLLAVPFSLIGAVWLLFALGYNMSIAVWVGMIALMGLDAETGVFMLMYLDLAGKEAAASGRLRTSRDLDEAIVEGAVKRVRPKMMTVCAMFLGLVPIMWSHGAGADMMKRIAAPMIGGIFSSFVLELLVYPAIYSLWKQREMNRAPVPAQRAL